MINTESSFLFPVLLHFQGYLNWWTSVNKIHIFFILQYILQTDPYFNFFPASFGIIFIN